MPLSEHEQQLLEQMERAFYEEDPRFASVLRGGADRYIRRRRYLTAGAIFLVGAAVVVLGVLSRSVPIGGVGFAIMVAGAAFAAAPRKPSLGTVQPDGSVRHPAVRAARRRADDGQPLTGFPGRPRRAGTFMQRLEQRWEDRRDRGEF